MTQQPDTLHALIGQWRAKHNKRAMGGIWALSGFSFQIAIFLVHFFDTVGRENEDPQQLPEFEQLSDLLCPQDRRYLLVQVKRTLNRTRLKEALKEFYTILALSREETPTLTSQLRFQVACKYRPSPSLTPSDITMEEVVDNGDPETWQLLIRAFDEENPIIEEPDPLDKLYAVLWTHGIKNRAGLIEHCAGRLLESFGNPGPNVRHSLLRDLESLFHDAPRREGWTSEFKLLLGNDVALDPSHEGSLEVLTGQLPRLEHLRKGMFRERKALFSNLWEQFNSWQTQLEEQDLGDETPIFWISGRSGEGKSVLLLQLVAECIRKHGDIPLLHLKSGEDLPLFLDHAPKRTSMNDQVFGRYFAVIDDIYDLRNRDDWADRIRRARALEIPPVAIITCGPTEQREQFENSLKDEFRVVHFEVPLLDQSEMEDFIEWYENRTGKVCERSVFSEQNPLLVLFMFELARGEKISAFAKRIKRRLEAMQIFEAARAIAATWALYIDAPIALLEDQEKRDALDRLCKDDQLHFRISYSEDGSTEEGVRFAHAHIAWLLYTEWAELPPTPFAKSWARDLDRSLGLWESQGNYAGASILLHRAFRETRLANGLYVELNTDHCQLLQELYRLHCQRNANQPLQTLMPRWLEMLCKSRGLVLKPDPVLATLKAMEDESAVSSVQGYTVGWLWRLTALRPPTEQGRIRNMVQRFLDQFPEAPGSGTVVGQISKSNQSDQQIHQWVLSWIQENPLNPQTVLTLSPMLASHSGNHELIDVAKTWLSKYPELPQAHWLIARLVACNPGDEIVKNIATDWLKGFPEHPQAYQVITALVRARPGEKNVVDIAKKWLNDFPKHLHAYNLIAALVAANQVNEDIIGIATEWLQNFPDHPQAYILIATLVAANQVNEDIIGIATQWLQDFPDHPQGYQVVAALVAANQGDEDIIGIATQWLKDFPDHPQAYILIATLVAANQVNEDIIGIATEWLQNFPDHPQGYQVVAALVAANQGDEGINRIATQWLKDFPEQPQAYHVVAALVAANQGDESTKIFATEWLDENSNHPQIHKVIVTLISAWPDDPMVEKTATEWLSNNENHAGYVEMLSTIIARSVGAEKWLRCGEAYLARPNCRNPEGIISVLVTAGKANADAVDRALDYFDAPSTPKKSASFVRIQLSKALANNLENTVAYLYGVLNEERNRFICDTLAYGLAQNPEGFADFIEVHAPDLMSEYEQRILCKLILLKQSTDAFDEWVATWLVRNYRRPGYGGVLQAIRNRPALWGRLIELNALNSEIIWDYEHPPI
ncbi:MAG: hypothetical protein HYV27_00805 [Candidatus Hydrogenedentes bacterium]|nr:hypothetical protein [Candidatus Hydrogenedentota bacterium]